MARCKTKAVILCRTLVFISIGGIVLCLLADYVVETEFSRRNISVGAEPEASLISGKFKYIVAFRP